MTSCELGRADGGGGGAEGTEQRLGVGMLCPVVVCHVSFFCISVAWFPARATGMPAVGLYIRSRLIA